MLNTQLIITNLLLFDFILLKQRAVLSFHMDSFQDAIIVDKDPDDKQTEGYLEKKLFRVETNILPDSFDNYFHAS